MFRTRDHLGAGIPRRRRKTLVSCTVGDVCAKPRSGSRLTTGQSTVSESGAERWRGRDRPEGAARPAAPGRTAPPAPVGRRLEPVKKVVTSPRPVLLNESGEQRHPHGRSPKRGHRPGAGPADHAIGRSRGGLTTKIHLACDGRGRPLSVMVTAGNVNDSTRLVQVLAGIRVPRIGPGVPRTRPDHLVADKGYSSRAIRRHLRQRGIGHTIPGV